MKSNFNYFLLFFSLPLLVLSQSRQFRCDYSYFRNIEGWLKLHIIPANWLEARLRCYYEGGNLVSPSNSAMIDAIKLITTANNVSCGVFTGIHATFSKGDFYSIEGVPLGKIPHMWAEDEPDNDRNEENCMLLLQDGTVADVNCANAYPYVCYKKKTSSMIANACGTVDPAYTLDVRTGSCYKLHTVPRTWSRAYMTCAAEGGYLAILNSETEAQIIREVFARTPANSILGKFVKDNAFIGFQIGNDNGEWLTIQGQTLPEAGYYKFTPGEPNTSYGQVCGAVYRTGLLDDVACHINSMFICEKSPDSLLCDDGKK